MAQINGTVVARVTNGVMYLVPISGRLSKERAVVALNDSAQELWTYISGKNSFFKEDILNYINTKYGDIISAKEDVNEFWQLLLTHDIIYE